MTHPARTLCLLCFFAGTLLGFAAPIAAQQARPAGVIVARRCSPANPAPVHAVRISSDSARHHPWRWIGAGALLGGATGGTAAAVAASRTDDAFLVGPAIGVATAAGAVVGG